MSAVGFDKCFGHFGPTWKNLRGMSKLHADMLARWCVHTHTHTLDPCDTAGTTLDLMCRAGMHLADLIEPGDLDQFGGSDMEAKADVLAASLVPALNSSGCSSRGYTRRFLTLRYPIRGTLVAVY